METIWMLAVVGGVSTGAGLLAWGCVRFLSDIVHLSKALVRGILHLRPLSLSDRLRALSTRESPQARPSIKTGKLCPPVRHVPVWAGAAAYGILGALLAHDWLLSPYLLALGVALAFFLSRFAVKRADLSKEVAILIGAFRSQYAVRPAVFAALEAVADILPRESPLRRAVETACAYNRLARADALAPLRELGDETLSQLVHALETDTIPEAMVKLLKEMEERIKARRRVREAAEGALVLFMGTIYVLAGANLVLALVVLVVPLMRHYFVAQLDGRLLYMFLTAAAASGGAYFLLETRATEEQIV